MDTRRPVPMAVIGAILLTAAALTTVVLAVKYRTGLLYMLVLGVLSQSGTPRKMVALVNEHSGGNGLRIPYSTTHLTDTYSFLINYLTIMFVPPCRRTRRPG